MMARKSFNIDWPADSILPAVIPTLSSNIAERVLHRRLINKPYVGLEERVLVRRHSFLSSSSVVVHLGVLLVQDQEGVQKVFREMVFILFLQVQYSNISVHILDSFNTEELYKDSAHPVALKHLHHKFTYDYKIVDREKLQTNFLKIHIQGEVWLHTSAGWMKSPQRTFRDRSRFLMAANPTNQFFRLIR